MSPLYVTRVPSVYSLHQLNDGIPGKGLVPTPYSPVSDIPGQLLPKLSYSPAAGTTSKRVRSFGNLQAHLVPDVDEPRCEAAVIAFCSVAGLSLVFEHCQDQFSLL